MSALALEGVSKRFGRVRALDQVSFEVAPGEVFGYLGPNGAGKTTTLRIALDLVRADRGRVTLLGESSRRARARRRLGYLPGDLKLYDALTAWQAIRLFARLRGGSAPLRDRLVAVLALAPGDLARRLKLLSHGTRQKVGLVIAMQHDPELLLLDEPTTGLDPLVQRAFRALLLELSARGRAVLLSSHVLSEIEAVCHRAAVLRAGRVLAVDAIQALRDRLLREARIRFRGEVPALEGVPGVARLERRGAEVVAWVRGDVNPLLRRLAACELESLVLPEPTLEDVFMGYYGGEAP